MLNELPQFANGVFFKVIEDLPYISVQGYNKNREVFYWNQSSTKLYGYTKEEALGKKLEDLIIPDSMKEDVVRLINRWIKDDVPIPASELELLKKDGSTVSVHSSHMMTKDLAGDPFMFCIDVNLKEHKDTEKLYKTLVDSVPHLIFLKDQQHRYVSCNENFKNFFGFKDKDLIGKSDFNVFPEKMAKICRQMDNDAIQSGQTVILDEPVVDKNGNDKIIHTFKKLVDFGDKSLLVCISEDITELSQSKEKLDFLTNYDTLTKLPNRQLLQIHLDELIQKRHKGALLFLDLDNFKLINDTLGHEQGDFILTEATVRIKKELHSNAFLSRWGGDEFTILVEEYEDIASITRLVEALLASFKEPFKLNENEIFVTTSIGISLFPEDGKNSKEILSHADSAMYSAKESGKNNFRFFSQEMNTKAMSQLLFENSLHKALPQKEFELYFQPQIDLHSRKLIGAEALIRWNNKELGIVSPAQFIPIAEKSKFIIELGDWIIEEVCLHVKMWKDKGLEIPPIAINCSGKQLSDSNFTCKLFKNMEKYDVRVDEIELEITESVLVESSQNQTNIFDTLKERGIKFSIDDFGTGYSSLQYLRRFPINRLKIDRSFIQDIDKDEEALVVTKAIIAMVEILNLDVIAEGAETKEHIQTLREIGCHEVQGYFFSRPLPRDAFEEYLNTYEMAIKELY